ncbi:hypothetical protein V4E86_16080 [Burkholderia pseudomallei]|uniref:hypothetical protein n=1 Tax=Burkholderia pseudomallei TaxID=28450 RepID=UPI00050E6397|nr:hypothetical protein [Burkholderia pseudomallei]KGC60753.1 DNA polymerase III subunit gamma/tau domain protein [Burkholderia mallei]KGW96313.1 DNA polymerase III subunit gamma/tau domain protein [Burkholderia pseudomallei MSHR332]KGC39672.1 hypothetical protein DO73_4256 [Burkholderia pseudomallei]KGC79477.1 DNA polymerase III subunit gamma/tau domain protein [Burkholderia pseudomallei]KGD15823.1 hypothetical protein DO70_4024 [Burkholderia pseudomallei]
MQTPAVERVRERPDDVLLADERSEILRTPLACENLIGHREIVSATLRAADRLNAAKRTHAVPIGEAKQKRRKTEKRERGECG